MTDDVAFPSKDRTKRTVVTEGFFEREVYLSRAETASFLRDLADALDGGDELTVTGDDWKIPFPYREPIEVEIEFTKQRHRELEIELEFSEPRNESDLGVE